MTVTATAPPKKKVKVPLTKQANLSHATARKAYAVKSWLTSADDLAAAGDKAPPVPAGSIVLLRMNPADSDEESLIYKVDLSGAAPKTSKLIGTEGAAPSWADAPLSVYTGSSYGALWLSPPEAVALHIDLLLKTLRDDDWFGVSPSTADATAGRLIVRRAVRFQINLLWFDGSPASAMFYNLHVGPGRTLFFPVMPDGTCDALINLPPPGTQATFGLRSLNKTSEMWTRPFNIVT